MGDYAFDKCIITHFYLYCAPSRVESYAVSRVQGDPRGSGEPLTGAAPRSYDHCAIHEKLVKMLNEVKLPYGLNRSPSTPMPNPLV